jgi:hypothetical protein
MVELRRLDKSNRLNTRAQPRLGLVLVCGTYPNGLNAPLRP